MSRIIFVLTLFSTATLFAQSKVQEVRLGTWDDERGETVFTPNGRHIAYAAARNGAFHVICDGREGPAFRGIGNIVLNNDASRVAYHIFDGKDWTFALDGITRPEFSHAREVVFSPDGQHVALANHTGNFSVTVLVDGKTVGIYEGMGLGVYGSPVSNPIDYSPDGSYLTYFATSGLDQFLVIDGKPGAPFSLVGRRVFSDNSRHVAYVGWNSKKQVVVDGKAGEAFETFSDAPPVFSPDGTRIAYPAWGNGHWFIVCDEKHGPDFDFTGSPVFSADSHRIAYPALSAGKWKMMIDGGPEKEFDSVFAPVFSPDGMHIAYTARADKKWLIVSDSKPGPLFDSVGAPIFSHNGTHLAYTVRMGEKSRMVVDGKPGDACDGLGQPVFSDDESHLAFAQRTGSKWCVLHDGVRGPDFDDVGPITFSPGRAHLAYTARRGKKWVIIVDEKPSAEVDGADPAVFSADGEHLATRAMLNGKSILLLDGSVAATYDQVMKAEPMFNNAGDIEFLATKAHALLRVTIQCKG